MFVYVPVIILGPGAIAMKKQTKKKKIFFFLQSPSLRIFYTGDQEEAIEK